MISLDWLAGEADYKECVAYLEARYADREAHWSLDAVALGRMSTSSELPAPAGEPRPLLAWAQDHLDFSESECKLLLKLWSAMRQHAHEIPLGSWRQLAKSRALLLLEVLGAGGDGKRWFAKAAGAETTEAFRVEVERWLGREVWVTWKLQVPQELVGVIEQALICALPHVLEDKDITGKPEDLVKERAHRFRCLEAICVHFVQTGGAG